MYNQDCLRLFFFVYKHVVLFTSYAFDCVVSFIVLNAIINQLQAYLCLHYNVLAEAICYCLLQTTLFTTN